VTEESDDSPITPVRRRMRPGDGRGPYGGDVPPVLVRIPNKRHVIKLVGPSSEKAQGKLLNSVVESTVDLAADVTAINRGEGRRDGQHYWINGRKYFVKPDGGSYPVDGPGVHRLSGGAYQALKVYNEIGLTEAAETRLNLYHVTEDEREIARQLYGR